MKEAQLKQIRDLLPKFCPIPRGIVLMGTPNEQLSDLAKRFGGTRESYAEEAPQHPVEIAAFAMAQVPVTPYMPNGSSIQASVRQLSGMVRNHLPN